MTTRCLCSQCSNDQRFETFIPQNNAIGVERKSPLQSISSHLWVRRASLCQKLKKAKSDEESRRRHSSALAKPEKDMLENPSEEDPDTLRRIKLWYPVQGNQSWIQQHAAPRSVAPALCVQEAVVHQFQPDPVHAVMTAVGNCYVSVPFQALQE